MTVQKTLLTASPQVVAERAHVAKILSELGDANRVLGQSAKSRRARTRAIELLIQVREPWPQRDESASRLTICRKTLAKLP